MPLGAIAARRALHQRAQCFCFPPANEIFTTSEGTTTISFSSESSALFDLGVYEYVQLVRLKRASDELGFHSWRSVIEVALESGYESPEASARVFKKHFGQTPSQFQHAPDWRGREQLRQIIKNVRIDYMTPQYQHSDVKLVEFAHTLLGRRVAFPPFVPEHESIVDLSLPIS